MRLLNVHTLAFTIFPEDSRPDYAIASHRWLDGKEAMFEDIVERREELEGYKKVVGFAEYVKSEIPHLKWLWIDTCCIKQNSDRELSEAINSMFRWYREAEVCLAYLADVAVADDMPSFRRSDWFRRAWTLQELIAPELVVFLTRDWRVIGHKGFAGDLKTLSIESGHLLNHEIAAVTSIPEEILQDYGRSRQLSVEEKLEWSEGRSATRGEDLSYSLLGILDMSVNIRYGEGEEKTRSRLLKKIAKSKESGDGSSTMANHVPFSAKDIPFLDHYVPRESSMGKLRLFFKSPNVASERQRVFVVHGMPGIGKTQLCAHFARTHHSRFSAVFWLDGSSRDSLTQSIARIVPRLQGYREDSTVLFEGAPAYRVHPDIETAAAQARMSKLLVRFQEWMARPDNNRWLLILDNVNRDWPSANQDPRAYDYQDFFDVNSFLPKIRHGNILITTCSEELRGTTESLRLQPMDDETARLMLQVRAQRLVENIDLVLPCCHGLPLAISLGGALLSDPDITAKEIVSRVDSSSPTFKLEHVYHPSSSCSQIIRDHGSGSMQDKLSKVIAISYNRLRKNEPIAARLLKLWSLVGCIDVSPELILMGKKAQLEIRNYAADNAVTEADKYGMNLLLSFLSQATKSTVQDQMDVLRCYAMLPASEGKGSTRIHPTIRALCLHTTDSPAIDTQLLSIAVTLVATMVRSFGYERMLHGLVIGLPIYAQAIGACIGSLYFNEKLATETLAIAGYLEQWEYSSEVENLYLYARGVFQPRLDSRSNHAAYKLAVLYHNQGYIDKAERRLISIQQPTHKSERNTDTLLSCELLGSIAAEREQLPKAQYYLERARQGFERTQGPWSPSTLRATRKLGHVCLRRGQSGFAEQLFLLARDGPRDAGIIGGSLHLSQLLAGSALVEVYVRSGRLDLAEHSALSACEEAEKLLGSNHASTFAAYYTLAMVKVRQGKLEQAKARYQKAVEGRSAILSKDHIDIYATFVQLGPVSADRQEPTRALPRPAFEAFCELYPGDGPGPLVALTSLAHFSHRQGRLQEAETLCRKALKTQIRYLDNCHELVPVTTFCLGMILRDQGKTDQAVSTLIDAIQDLERFAVSQRDLLLSAYRALGSAYSSKNRSLEADEVSRQLQRLYDDATPRSSADQRAVNAWLENLRLSIPKQVYEAEYDGFAQAAEDGVKPQRESADNDYVAQAAEDGANPQPEPAGGGRLEEASEKVGRRSRLLSRIFGAKS